MDFNQAASQIQSAVLLYSDILLCMLAASVLGWIIGLMMQRSRHRQQLSQQDSQWQGRYEALEDSSRSDSANLEEQLQSLAKETKALQATNRTITDSLKKNDTNVQKSRAEAIELNRQHTETHERLQRIIQHKDREIAELSNRLSMDSHALRNANSSEDQTTWTPGATEDHSPILEKDLNNADTVAISPRHLASEIMDATVQMSVDTPRKLAQHKPDLDQNADLDASLDDTFDLSNVGLEESTIAMDDEAIAFIQRSNKSKQD